MNVDELVRELHRQADDTQGWPPPTIAQLRSRRSAVRRRTGTVGAVLAVAAIVVVSTVLVHGNHRTSAPPTAPVTSSPGPVPGLSWSLEQCPPPNIGDCTTPYILRALAGRYTSRQGGRMPVHDVYGLHTALSLRTKPGSEHLILLGARGAGPRSELVAVVDGRRYPLDRSGPTLLPLPPRSVEVTVREEGHAGPHEQLVMEEYVPLS